MGTEALQGLASGAFDSSQNPRQTLEITPGNRQADWEEFVNMRLQDDGPYLHWKKRGGSTLQKSVTGNILTQFSFTATIDGTIKDYIAMHTDAGHAYLWEKDAAAAPTQIFTGAFTTTSQISILADGVFLYLFDYEGQVYKVYNIAEDSSYDWMSRLGGSVASYSWLTGNFTDDNIWGFAEGEGMGVYHKYLDGQYEDPETGLLSFRSFRTDIDRVYDGHLVYSDPAGEQRQTNDGLVSLFPDSPDLASLVGKPSNNKNPQQAPRGIIEPVVADGASDHEFTVSVGGIFVPEEGTITSLSSDSLEDIATKIETALEDSTRITAEYVVSRSGAIVYVDAKQSGPGYVGREVTVDHYDDPADLAIKTTDLFISDNIVENADFEEVSIFRGYLLVDLLADGSFGLPGRPITVRTKLSEIQSSVLTGVELTVSAAAANVEKRFLYATRWQTSSDNVFSPSRPAYDNSAWMLARQVRTDDTSIKDFTPDSKLTQPLSGDIPLVGGVYDMFGPGGLSPEAVATIAGSLLIGGYTINRPTPSAYTDPDNPGQDNCFVNIISGADLPEDYQVGFVFEYTDGKKSEVALSGQNLTDGTEEVESAVSAIAATTPAQKMEGPLPVATSGFVSTTYDGQTVTTNWDSSLAGEDTAVEVAQKHRDAINADPDIGVDASISVIGPEEVNFFFEARTAGTSENGKSVKGGTSGSISLDPTYVLMSGGEGGEPAEVRSANQVHLHSLNALVSKVFIVAKEGTADTYRLLEEIEISDPQAHGGIILLPNATADVQAKDAFSLPSGSEIQTSQDLFNWIVPAVPAQQVQISEQTKIEGQARIRRIIPTQYDPDKTQMRYRLAVFTDRNLQLGYIVFGGQGISSNFEIVGEGVELAHRFGGWYVGGAIVFASRTGVHLLQGNQYPIIIDKREYDVAGQDLQKVVYSREWEEYWMCFSGGSDNKILAYDPAEESIRSFTWPGSLGALRIIDYAVDTMILGIDAGLYYTDLDGVHDDEGTEIQGEMITKHLGTQTTQTKILEATVAGQGYACQIALDQQKARLEGDPAVWSKDFIEDFVTSSKDLNQAGAPFQFHKRAVMPKLKIKLTGTDSGFVSLVDIKYIETANTGKARST